MAADRASRAPGHDVALAVTMGEPAGIGPDITLLAWHAHRTAPSGLPPFAVYADSTLLSERALALGLSIPVETVASATEATRVFKDALPVVSVPLHKRPRPGKPDADAAQGVITAIEHAVADVRDGKASAVVTNPIAKSVLMSKGFAHPGHTEFLEELANRWWPSEPGEAVMMLASDDVRVVPLTIHVPLRDVPPLVTRDLILSTANVLDRALKNDFGLSAPRIAVAGLNPHAGESGMLGHEEIDIIAPAIAELRASGVDASGPASADTMFHEAARRAYDAALMMYHDQALIPVKTLSFDSAVNVTLGLPFVRTSPDHGTAFEIAGTGKASPASFIAALKMASRMAEQRLQALTR